MDSIQIYCGYLNMEVFHQKPTIFSQEIMWTEESSLWKPFVYYWLIKSNIQRTSFSYEETMSVLASIAFMDSMMNVSKNKNLFFINGEIP